MPINWIEHPKTGLKINSESFPVVAKGKYNQVLSKSNIPDLPITTTKPIKIPENHAYTKVTTIKNTYYSKGYLSDIFIDMYGPEIRGLRGKNILLDLKYSYKSPRPIALRDPNSETWYFLAPIHRRFYPYPEQALKHLDGGW